MKKIQNTAVSLSAKQKANLMKCCKSFFRFIFMLSFAYVLLYPIIYMFSTAVKNAQDFIDPTVQWISKQFDFSSFPNAIKAMNYGESLKNTLLFEMLSCLIEVATCSAFAYGLSRFDIPFKKLLIFVLVITIMVPDVMLLMPRVMHFKRLDILGIFGLLNKLTGIDLRPNLIDTAFAFYLPSLFGVGLKGGLIIFIYMQFYKGLPKELEEAASVDGAGPLKTFIRIIIPSSSVVILTVFIFSMVWHWNDYYLGLMYTSENRTLAYVVQNLNQYVFVTFGEISHSDPRVYTIPMAGCLLFIAPPTLVYLVLQKQFIQSVDRVGIVG